MSFHVCDVFKVFHHVSFSLQILSLLVRVGVVSLLLQLFLISLSDSSLLAYKHATFEVVIFHNSKFIHSELSFRLQDFLHFCAYVIGKLFISLVILIWLGLSIPC